MDTAKNKTPAPNNPPSARLSWRGCAEGEAYDGEVVRRLVGHGRAMPLRPMPHPPTERMVAAPPLEVGAPTKEGWRMGAGPARRSATRPAPAALAVVPPGGSTSAAVPLYEDFPAGAPARAYLPWPEGDSQPVASARGCTGARVRACAQVARCCAGVARDGAATTGDARVTAEGRPRRKLETRRPAPVRPPLRAPRQWRPTSPSAP